MLKELNKKELAMIVGGTGPDEARVAFILIKVQSPVARAAIPFSNIFGHQEW